MRTFEYSAVDLRGRRVRGRALATSEQELDLELERAGATLTAARAVEHRALRGGHRIDPHLLHQLTTQLATVTSAGVPIVEGLRGIARRVPDERVRLLLEEIVTDLEAGEGLSSALDRHPRAFPAVYRSSVRAGEASGALDRVLLRLARYLEWAQTMKSTTIQALIYPGILCVAISGLIGILLYFVLPRIMKIFPGGRDDLPAQTRFVLGASDLLVENVVLVVGVLVASAAAFVLTLRQPRGREFLHGVLLRIPKLGRVAGQLATSRFASTAATLQQAGCDVFTVLRISGETCGNAAMAAGFGRVGEAVRNGCTIADALEREPDVDPLLTQMVSVGERTGSLDACLGRVVEYYDDEVPRAVKRFLSFFEPAILVVAGAVVTFILLAALMPMFTLYETL